MTSGINKETGLSTKFIDLKGKRFGRYLVINRSSNRVAPSGVRRTMYLCKCDCGNYRKVAASSLVSEYSKSCGCLRGEVTREANSLEPFRSLYNKLCSLSKTNNRTVELTFEEFKEFTNIQDCHYCDIKLVWNSTKRDGQSFAYNLDRKDSKKGYSKENCVTCCIRCNQSKSNTFSYEEWVEIGKTIKKYREQHNR